MTTTEPTPEAVEALARVVLPAMPNHCCPPGDLTDCPYDAHDADGIARVVLAAGYVDHGTYAAAAMARDAAEQMHDRLAAENDRLMREVEKAKEREIAARARGLKYHGETEQVRRLAEDVLTMLGPA